MSAFYTYDRNFILSQSQIWNFALTNASMADLHANGCYTYMGSWYKDFTLMYNGEERKLQVLLNVTEVSDGVYNVSVAGIEYVYDTKNALSNATKAMGVFFHEKEEDFLATQFEADTVRGILTAQGYVKLPYTFLEELYQLLYTHYDMSPNPYQYESIVREDGQYILVDWDNDTLADAISGIAYDGEYNILDKDSDAFNEWLKEKLNDTTDSRMQAIRNSDAMKVMVRSWAPGDGWINIVGYKIENNTFYVSNDGTQISATMTEAHQICYQIEDGVETVYTQGDATENRSINFSNQEYSGFYNFYGGSWSGVVAYQHVYDSIGYNGQLKQFTLNGQTPTGRGLEEDYPTWATSTKWLPVSDTDPDMPPTQVYYQIGRPGKDRYIKVYPSPNEEEEQPSDKDTPEDTRPDVDGLQTVQGLFSVYKLNIPLVKMLGDWLWDADGVNLDKLLQIWKNDPLQSIISLHQLYFDPTTSGEHSIVLGNVDTGISSAGDVPVKLVADRYQHLECGFIHINRYFNDFRDYQTKISIYLPFIGIRELDTREVMGSVVELSYYVDVLTGDCTATLSLNRDKPKGGRMTDNKCLYMWNGNCASMLPITANDKSTLYRNVGLIGKGVVSTVAGALTKNVSSVAGGISGIAGTGIDMATSHQQQIEKTGSLGGNFGAMGFKKPYLIIEKPLPVNPTDRGKYLGKPCNKTLKVGDVTGYTEFMGIHVDTMGTITDEERAAIDNALRSGVIL